MLPAGSTLQKVNLFVEGLIFLIRIEKSLQNPTSPTPKRNRTVSIMFEKSLTDLVKGIRSHKHNEEAYIRNVIAEIKNELKTSDIKKKAVAIQKLTYVCC